LLLMSLMFLWIYLHQARVEAPELILANRGPQ